MSIDVRDTRDTPTKPLKRIGWPILGPGEIDELRIFLQDVLQIPAHARRFSVTFESGQVMVSVDYLPSEMRSTLKDE